MKTEKENLATRFLLGKLTEAENIRLEKEFFNSHQAFEEIIFAEFALLDAYVTGALSTGDATLFENRLMLNPSQKQKVEFAKTLVKYASGISRPAEEKNLVPGQSSWISFISHFLTNKPELAFIFIVVVLIFCAGILLIFKNQDSQFQQRDQLTVIQIPVPVQNQSPVNESNSNNQTEEPRTENTASEKPVDRKPPPNKPEKQVKQDAPVILSLVLAPGLTRDAGASQKFTIPENTDFVRMRLKIEAGSFSSYHAILETVEGHQVWNSRKLKVQKGSRSLAVSIPSTLLKKADYILTLKGVNPEGLYENADSYTFTVLRAKSND